MKKKVPNLTNAVVEDAKMRDYLLNSGHPDGKSKAIFFTKKGFRVNDLPAFREMLINHAKSNQVMKEVKTEHGVKYVVEGPVNWPGLNVFNLRTVWSIDKDSKLPKLATAYPVRE